MGLVQICLFILAFLLFIAVILITRLYYKYYRLENLSSKLPIYRGFLFTNGLLQIKWNCFNRTQCSNSFQTIPSSVAILQKISGLCKCFHEGFFFMWMFIFPHVFIYKAEIVQALINHTAAKDKAIQQTMLEVIGGIGLITSKGELWKNHRKLLTPAFHLSILKEYISIYNEHALILVGKLQTLTKDPWIELAPLLRACSFDVILEAAMGLKTKCQEGNNEGKIYMENVDELLDLIAYRMIRPWTYIDVLFNLFPRGRKLQKHVEAIKTISEKIIKKKKEAYLSNSELKGNSAGDNNNRRRKSFIEILLDTHFNDKTFSSKAIQDEVNTFIVAGYDTLSTTLNYVLYLVGLDKNVQENIIQELEYIFQNDRKRIATYDDLNQMKYLECVIKETLRLYPPIPVFVRTLNEDVKVGNYTIPKGSILTFVLSILHRDPEVFPNPEKFDPERFNDENSVNRHPFAFMPFSAGSRNCIGQRFGMMEMKVILAHIFRNFTFESLEHRDKINLSFEILLKNREPIRSRIIARHE